MKIHELLANAAAWTQCATARDGAGNPVAASHPEARCWCIFGAALHCYGPKIYGAILDRISEKAGITHSLSEREWNDSPERTHADILRVVRAIDV